MSDATRVRRRRVSYDTDPRWSIFDCVPFNSDRDLPPRFARETGAILNDIYDIIPSPSICGWSCGRSKAG
jgi:hypothetical protein